VAELAVAEAKLDASEAVFVHGDAFPGGDFADDGIAGVRRLRAGSGVLFLTGAHSGCLYALILTLIGLMRIRGGETHKHSPFEAQGKRGRLCHTG
jgi:hypothetical protein